MGEDCVEGFCRGEGGFVGHENEVVVLVGVAYAREVYAEGDSCTGEEGGTADARAVEDGRGAQGAGGDDDLLASVDGADGTWSLEGGVGRDLDGVSMVGG